MPRTLRQEGQRRAGRPLEGSQAVGGSASSDISISWAASSWAVTVIPQSNGGGQAISSSIGSGGDAVATNLRRQQISLLKAALRQRALRPSLFSAWLMIHADMGAL